MRIDIITLFPAYFDGPMAQSMMRKATEHEYLEFAVHDLRQWGIGPRKQVDDTPYGGGAGMVLRPEPLFAAMCDLSTPTTHRIFLTPHGETFSQPIAERIATEEHLILVAGHYEGIDQRVRDELIDEEISIGDYVLTGGELPALVIIDSVVRLIPGVLGDTRSPEEESFSEALDRGLEYPHYTRPEKIIHDGRELAVPDVLLSGHHVEIEQWRKAQSAKLTRAHRDSLDTEKL
jgi:tRNA (guanine37-N1)-methyltransferase